MCKNCKCLRLHISFNSEFIFFTRLSVGSLGRSHGLGIIAETIIFVDDLDLMVLIKSLKYSRFKSPAAAPSSQAVARK